MEIGLVITVVTVTSGGIVFVLNKVVSRTKHEDKQDKKIESIESAIALIKEHNCKQDKSIERLEVTTTETNLSMKAIETDVKWLRAYMEDRR